LIEKVRALPGIESAGFVDGLPLTLYINNSTIFVEGKPSPRVSEAPVAAMYVASPGYFHTVRTKLEAGRDFEARDRQGAAPVVVVNRAFATLLLPGENPIGKRFRYGLTGDWRQIVGVVEDGKYRSLGESPIPVVFRPYEQSWNPTMTLVARSSMPEEEIVRMLRRSVQELDPVISIYGAGSLVHQLGLALFPAKLAATVLSAFGLLAVVLAATGVYGIMAYAVSRRTREIGIRMALGAAPAQVLRVVMSRTALLLCIGTAAGLGLALAAGRFFSLILYGVSARDPLTYALVIGMIALVAFAACWLPARRAISVDPMTALRTE
jgi:predicted permease